MSRHLVHEGVLCDDGLAVIGDVHGCLDELLELLEKIGWSMERSRSITVVLVGDLVNKGPKSLEVLRFAKAACSKVNFYAVRGNHDEAALKAFHKHRNNPDETIPDKYRWTLDMTEDDASFIESLPYTITFPQHNTLVVHAGLNNSCPDLESQSCEDLVSIRAWAQNYRGFLHVVFGHDAKRGLQQQPNATGIDTGCVYGRELTALLILDARAEIRTLVQVKARAVYSQPIVE